MYDNQAVVKRAGIARWKNKLYMYVGVLLFYIYTLSTHTHNMLLFESKTTNVVLYNLKIYVIRLSLSLSLSISEKDLFLEIELSQRDASSLEQVIESGQRNKPLANSVCLSREGANHTGAQRRERLDSARLSSLYERIESPRATRKSRFFFSPR